MRYEEADEEIILVNNPSEPWHVQETVDMPFERFDLLRVRVAMLRPPGFEDAPVVKISGPEDTFDALASVGLEPIEVVVLLLLDTKNTVIGIFEAHRGALRYSLTEPRLLAQAALLSNASRAILVHNHPSGDPTPSFDDSEMTAKVKNALDCIGVELLDSVVIGQDSYYSFAEEGAI